MQKLPLPLPIPEKIKMREQHTIWLSVMASLIILTLVPTHAATVDFSATFTQSTCNVTVPSLISFGDITPQEIKDGNSIANPRPLEVTFSDCNGFLLAGQRAGIKVMGSGNSETGGFLFSQVGDTTAVNYGVLLTKVGSNNPIASGTFVEADGNASTIPANGSGITFNTSLSCGNKCNDPATKGGALNAAITFTFAYE